MSNHIGGSYNTDYKILSMSDLILFCIDKITSSGEICTFERLVAECYTRFPKVFSFKRYPQWPDSLKFDRPLRTLREKGLIVGSIKDHFLLTDFGRLKLAEVINNLQSESGLLKREPPKKKSQSRSTDDRLIEYLKSDPYFQHYIKNPKELSMSEAEFRNILRCTLETPLRVVKQNLEYYKKVAKSYNEDELYNFLVKCGEKFLTEGNSG